MANRKKQQPTIDQPKLTGIPEGDPMAPRHIPMRTNGRRLMPSLVSWSVKRGLTRLQLPADRNNRPALDFYRPIGWRSTRLICLRTTELADQ